MHTKRYHYPVLELSIYKCIHVDWKCCIVYMRAASEHKKEFHSNQWMSHRNELLLQPSQIQSAFCVRCYICCTQVELKWKTISWTKKEREWGNGCKHAVRIQKFTTEINHSVIKNHKRNLVIAECECNIRSTHFSQRHFAFIQLNRLFPISQQHSLAVWMAQLQMDAEIIKSIEWNCRLCFEHQNYTHRCWWESSAKYPAHTHWKVAVLDGENGKWKG